MDAALIHAVPMPLVLVGASEWVEAANAGAESLFGPGMVGRHYITVLRQPPVLDCVEGALKTGKATHGRLPMRDAAGDKTFRITATPVGDTGRILLALDDVSHVEEASVMRRDFVANVSHELRTPLTALLGFIETLQGPARNDPAAQTRFLGIMQREASRMSRLIQDLLSLSRVEAAERKRPSEQVDIAALIRSVVTTLSRQAEETKVQVNVTGAEQAIMLPGDADQLLQVLTNLTENAIKYGGDRVDVSVARQANDPALRGASVRIEVADNGAGIDQQHIPRLTERFYRVDNHRSREMGGTGLGLAIVKHIINRHRGRLRIESPPGQGSRFIVILPAWVTH